ncbi:hypothetical protein LTR37_005852 [Vermiconidia calcicola]|uniref:Uncharacterized protein n=1 Tax=Vermiconidia calcicola TaxID=1690605 RepID=A0ACC3NIJ0_9PEZI|nr:hypothetical protein LTR37_005852 [Vermiconidia calcicola]
MLELSAGGNVDVTYSELTPGFEVLSTQPPLIHGFWVDEEATWLHMGLDVWQSTRLDRFAGSRVRSVVDNDAIASPKRMQTLRLMEDKQYAPPKKTLITPTLGQYQTTVHFLMASLRLGRADTTELIHLLVVNGIT